MKMCTVDRCACPALVAPYIWLVLRRAGQEASSIYRGDDPAAKPILHRFGKHTQRELHDATPAQRAAWDISGVPNAPGSSMHELRSDGRAKPGPVGRALAEWEVGVDSGANTPHDRLAIEVAARHYGWHVYHPYDSGVELHHWGFVKQPKARGFAQRMQIIKLRRELGAR